MLLLNYPTPGCKRDLRVSDVDYTGLPHPVPARAASRLAAIVAPGGGGDGGKPDALPDVEKLSAVYVAPWEFGESPSVTGVPNATRP